MAEQSVIANSVNSGSSNNGNTSGGTQVMERPQQVSGTGGTATSSTQSSSTKSASEPASAKSASAAKSVSEATSAKSASAAKSASEAMSATSASAAKSAGPGKTYPPSGGLEMEPKAIPFAAVSFVSGLVGLLVANLLLGPLAIVLGLIGLRVDSNRRVRAALGILLGVADIVVFVLLAAHAGAHHGSLSWSFLSH